MVCDARSRRVQPIRPAQEPNTPSYFATPIVVLRFPRDSNSMTRHVYGFNSNGYEMKFNSQLEQSPNKPVRSFLQSLHTSKSNLKFSSPPNHGHDMLQLLTHKVVGAPSMTTKPQLLPLQPRHSCASLKISVCFGLF